MKIPSSLFKINMGGNSEVFVPKRGDVHIRSLVMDQTSYIRSKIKTIQRYLNGKESANNICILTNIQLV